MVSTYSSTTTAVRTYSGHAAYFYPYQCGEVTRCLYIFVGDSVEFFQFEQPDRELPRERTYAVSFAALGDTSGMMSGTVRHRVPSESFAMIGESYITLESVTPSGTVGHFNIRVIHERTRELLASVNGNFTAPRIDRNPRR
jgi:hypothetical protein